MKLVSQPDFADISGLSTPTVNAHCQPGKALHKCVIGGKIDLEHPDAVAYIEARIQRHTDSKFTKPMTKKSSSTAEAVTAWTDAQTAESRHRAKMAELAADMRELAHLSLSKLIYYFGEDIRFLDWLKAIKMQEKIEEVRLKNAEKEGTLVRRELVHVGVMMVLDSALRGMLTDGAKTIATKSHAMAKSDRSVDEIEEYISGILGSYLKPAKAKMSRNLKGA